MAKKLQKVVYIYNSLDKKLMNNLNNVKLKSVFLYLT